MVIVMYFIVGTSITDRPSSQDWINLPVYLESVKSLKVCVGYTCLRVCTDLNVYIVKKMITYFTVIADFDYSLLE